MKDKWVGGCVGFDDLSSSILGCGMTLTSWKEKHFGDLPKEIKKCKEELAKLQVLPQSQEVVNNSLSLENRLGALLRKEEVYRLQILRVSWIMEGGLEKWGSFTKR